MVCRHEFAGCAPRGGVYGAKLLVAGAGPDYAATEVNQVLYSIERQGKLEVMRCDGERLRKAPVQQAGAAHRGRGRDFEAAQGVRGAMAAHKAADVDGSSADSAS